MDIAANPLEASGPHPSLQFIKKIWLVGMLCGEVSVWPEGLYVSLVGYCLGMAKRGRSGVAFPFPILFFKSLGWARAV
jgi:hypothetical protein